MLPCIQRNHAIIIGTLSCVFGIGSWIAMNGIWVELPNLINNLPEGWKLASYLTVIIQLANIGPIIYGILKRTLFKNYKERLQHFAIYTILTIGIASCLCLAFLWRETSFIFNENRSTALLLLTFLVAVVDCTSSVTFLPFMSVLPTVYMSPFYIGESLSGLLPALVALGQGVEEYKYIPQSNTSLYFENANITTTRKVLVKKLRFSQDVFFIILSIMMFSSIIAYVLLTHLPGDFYVSTLSRNTTVSLSGQTTLYNRISCEENDCNTDRDHGNVEHPLTPLHNNVAYTRFYILKLLIMMMFLNTFQNGVLAAISSFTYAPYGDLVYHLAATLGSIAAALSCCVFLFFPFKSEQVIVAGFIGYILCVAVIITTATQSPTPWLYQKVVGKVLIVIVSITSCSLVSYTKLAIASVMRDCGHQFLFYTGIAVQLGSFVGAVVMFPIVNYTHVFKSS